MTEMRRSCIGRPRTSRGPRARVIGMGESVGAMWALSRPWPRRYSDRLRRVNPRSRVAPGAMRVLLGVCGLVSLDLLVEATGDSFELVDRGVVLLHLALLEFRLLLGGERAVVARDLRVVL